MTLILKGERCAPSIRTRQRGSFDLPLAAYDAFDLFTAEGERRWVEGWNPAVLSGGDGSEPGSIFLTDHGGEHCIWTVIDANRQAGRLHYSRVSPGRRAGTVRVEIASRNGGSRISVSYDITALGPDGEAAVLAMDEDGFAEMLEQWRRRILASLELPA